MTAQETLIAKIRQMPEPLVQKVQEYVDFLMTRDAASRHSEIAPTLNRDNTDKPVIQLDIDTFGLILLRPSGVLYRNQTGGYICEHPQEEGVFAPLDLEELVQARDDISNHFTGEKWNGYCFEGIDAETASFLDAVFTRTANLPFGLTQTLPFLRVDRSRLQESHEAWIYVEVEEPAGVPEHNPFAGFGTCRAVLTWLNSD